MVRHRVQNVGSCPPVFDVYSIYSSTNLMFAARPTLRNREIEVGKTSPEYEISLVPDISYGDREELFAIGPHVRSVFLLIVKR